MQIQNRDSLHGAAAIRPRRITDIRPLQVRPTAMIVASLIMVTFLAACTSSPGPVETVLAFDGSAGELAESIAFDLQGNAYVTFAPIGEILKITPDGSQSTFAKLEPGDGFLAGVTVDEVGNVYAGLSSFNEETHGVWRIRQDGSSERIAAFPTSSLPNDMVLDKQGTLFVTDTIQGAVWRIPPNGEPEIWLQSDLLEGRQFDFFPFPLGANGIAFGKDGALYVTNIGFSRIVRIPVNPG